MSPLALLVGQVAASMASIEPTELWFNQTLDHFNPANTATWQHRYLFSDAHWGKGSDPAETTGGCPGPILFYTGNEGPIDAFWGSNGFMIDYLAPKWGGLLVFPEERYYGKSLPFGPTASWEASNMVYLTTEQILNDYVELIHHLKATLPNAAECPVVAFGGSYGGTLTTFLRTAYPETVIGGLAASAPVGYYDKEGWAAHGVDEFTWSDIVTKDYDESHPKCLAAIAAANALIETTPVDELIKAFHVCEAPGLGPTSHTDLFGYALESQCQLNYPYAIGSMPAWPVNHTCALLVDTANGRYPSQLAADAALLAAAASVTDAVLGYDGSTCIPTATEGPGQVPGDGPGDDSAWGWQSCTENLHQFSARGVRQYTFSLADQNKVCAKVFNNTVQPDPSKLARMYGGYKLGDGKLGVSNLIWSNGALDPWHGGGFLTPGDPKTGNHWIFMPNGAHHLDLRGPHPEDPPDITAARQLEESIIKGWIEADTAHRRARQ